MYEIGLDLKVRTEISVQAQAPYLFIYSFLFKNLAGPFNAQH